MQCVYCGDCAVSFLLMTSHCSGTKNDVFLGFLIRKRTFALLGVGQNVAIFAIPMEKFSFSVELAVLVLLGNCYGHQHSPENLNWYTEASTTMCIILYIFCSTTAAEGKSRDKGCRQN